MNDWTCSSAPDHDPVVMIHATGVSFGGNFVAIPPAYVGSDTACTRSTTARRCGQRTDASTGTGLCRIPLSKLVTSLKLCAPAQAVEGQLSWTLPGRTFRYRLREDGRSRACESGCRPGRFVERDYMAWRWNTRARPRSPWTRRFGRLRSTATKLDRSNLRQRIPQVSLGKSGAASRTGSVDNCDSQRSRCYALHPTESGRCRKPRGATVLPDTLSATLACSLTTRPSTWS